MIVRLEDQQTLVLIGYSLLTQFNVGILYFLSHTFKNVTMHVLDNLGCIITLENYCTQNSIIKNLEDILEVLNIAKNNDQDIISVIPITTLCADEIYQMVINMNHSIIKDFIMYIGQLPDGNGEQHDTSLVSESSSQKTPRLPPIVVTQNINDPSGFSKKLTEIAKHTITFKITGGKFYIFTTNKDDYTTIINLFNSKSMQYYTHAFSENKMKYMVLRGLPSIEDKLVANELTQLNLSANNVTKI
ncbi:Protein of unknown function, partial [Cotesia congregata]